MVASIETARLVLAAQEGDDVAVQHLFERYYPRVERIVRARLGRHLRARVEVEDILQETFLNAVLRLDEFEMRSESAFLDWLAVLSLRQINRAAEHWGREKRDPRRLVAIDAPDDAISRRVRELTARVSGPLTKSIRGERRRGLEDALDALEESQREVIVLRHFVGLSFEEIAGRIGRPTEAAAREFYRRARAKLAVILRTKDAGGSDPFSV